MGINNYELIFYPVKYNGDDEPDNVDPRVQLRIFEVAI